MTLLIVMLMASLHLQHLHQRPLKVKIWKTAPRICRCSPNPPAPSPTSQVTTFTLLRGDALNRRGARGRAGALTLLIASESFMLAPLKLRSWLVLLDLNIKKKPACFFVASLH